MRTVASAARIGVLALVAGLASSPHLSGCASHTPAQLTGLGERFSLVQLSPSMAEGERYRWDLTIRSLARAELEVMVGRPEKVQGVDALPVFATLRTRGWTRWFRTFDEAATTWIHPQSTRMLAQHRSMTENGKASQLRSLRGRAGLTMVKTKGQKSKVLTQSLPEKAALLDLQSLLLGFRSWRPELGRRTHFSFLASTRVWRAEMEHTATQRIKTSMGSLEAHRFDGRMRRLSRAGNIESKRRQFTIWVSADRRHLPLKMIADTTQGEVMARLVEYQGDHFVQRAQRP